MKVTILGSGTSHGVPMIGCDCPVCKSEDPRNKRTRSSAFVETDGANLLIDTAPELRLQAVRENIRRVDACLFTHAHADHIFGLDDVRRFNCLSGNSMPCYGSADTLRTLRRSFDYAFVHTQIGGGKPSLKLVEVRGPFDVNGVRVVPVPVFHGDIPVLGYRIGGLAYVTDCSRVPDESVELLQGLDVLVLGVLREEPHETHFSLEQGLEFVRRLEPKRAYFTHIAHRLDHEATNRRLPSGVELAYDGLQVELEPGERACRVNRRE